MPGYGEELAAVHAAGFTAVAVAGAREVLARLDSPSRVVEFGSFVDARLPERCDAILAVGEVLGYPLDSRNDNRALDRVFERAARALRRDGLLLFDLAGPGRVPRAGQRAWHEGEGWAVLVEAAAEGSELRRRIVSFHDGGTGCFRRSEEVHDLWPHSPSEILARLRGAGFAARTLPRGYAGEPLPPGVTAFVARRR